MPAHQPRLQPSALAGEAGPWLVCGLGNPGIEYQATRHNAGYLVLEHFLDSRNEKLKPQALSRAGNVALCAKLRLGYGVDAPTVVLAKTGTFMNVSGPAVKALLKFYELGPERLLVVHDDIDLDFGIEKLKIGGSNGGHNGLKSIDAALGTRDYARLRIGVGRPVAGDVVDWVLGRFSKTEQRDLPDMWDRAVRCLESLGSDGFAKAQAQLHLSNPKSK